ncbi:MAG: hypothetical protein BIFFINMI_02863 [Phycisphaerae bacterium]|nr:hypothetical protein [Phycisphaerae bacterium]
MTAPVESASYVVHRLGPWAPADISLRFVDEPFAPPPDVQTLAEQNFADEQAKAQAVGRKLFNGLLARVRSIDGPPADPPAMTLHQTDYKIFLTTNLLSPDRFAADARANVLGVSAILRSSDGLLVLGRRSQKVTYNRGKVHTLGGVAEWLRIPPGGACDGGWLVEVLLKELFEELGLEPEQAQPPQAMALLADRRIGQPEVVHAVQLELSSAALERAFGREGDIEHSALWTCADSPAAVLAELERGPARFSPVAVATLLAWLTLHHGPDALAAMK